jgi:hypothetical protein
MTGTAGPRLGQNPVVLSMHPRPQSLATDLPIAEFNAPELLRIVKAGARYGAMPSWPADGRDDEIWQLVSHDAGRRGGIAGDKPNDPIVVIARKMTDAQFEAVAAYRAQQP